MRGNDLEVFTYKTEAKRLMVRPLKEEDYQGWYKGFNERMPSQHRHDPGKLDMSECTEEWFASLVHNHQKLAAGDDAYIFGVFHKESGGHMGMIDFSTLARNDFQWGRIGYTIHNQYWGQGYGREAVEAAMQIALTELGYHRIEAHINLDNSASIKLAEGIGMEYECTRKGFIYEFGEWTDNLIYYKNAVQR
ncbi:N-acetyltransferase [Bacillus salacetis]|uniref:N-acetyltransferase n=1 Tax=Bacillus salacetis TaxID=2315464 RepID=A0A3A1R4J0_9BACI|nr:GNAT family N-acetyltransferase [Bacillus salacetis]RIW37277.1 N-acetyltransferase [Bacillus salacetis]